jgi:hypothetical protein
MTIIKEIKEVSPETESLRAEFRERQKERMSEVIAIRQAIVELFNTNPGNKGFTNKEILEWLISKGFNVNARQVPAKMNMLRNLFYEERKNGKAVWHRLVCGVCLKPLQLGEKSSFIEEMQLHGHLVCLQFIFKLYDLHKEQAVDYTLQIDNLNQEKTGLLEENAALQEEVKRLKSMVEFPSENHNSGRRIEL